MRTPSGRGNWEWSAAPNGGALWPHGRRAKRGPNDAIEPRAEQRARQRRHLPLVPRHLVNQAAQRAGTHDRLEAAGVGRDRAPLGGEPGADLDMKLDAVRGGSPRTPAARRRRSAPAARRRPATRTCRRATATRGTRRGAPRRRDRRPRRRWAARRARRPRVPVRAPPSRRGSRPGAALRGTLPTRASRRPPRRSPWSTITRISDPPRSSNSSS